MSETASQSVPMVSTSTGGMLAPGEAVPGDDGDDVFVAEAESEGWAMFHVIHESSSYLKMSAFIPVAQICSYEFKRTHNLQY